MFSPYFTERDEASLSLIPCWPSVPKALKSSPRLKAGTDVLLAARLLFIFIL
nr:hypothetical protein [Pedobacter alluvionis]